MIKNITGAEYPVSKIFSSDFDYSIPSYQRPYAWTVDEASELFDDLYDFHRRENEESYFLGSIVLIKSEGCPEAEVIDGQQRLTTLTILLAILTSQLSGDLKRDFENYIFEPGRASQGLKPKPRLALRERDRVFFKRYVQSLRFKDLLDLGLGSLNGEAQFNIRENCRVLLKRISEKFDGDEERMCEFGAFVVQRCFLVVVSTPSQKSAFRVFSVLNNRGLDLLPTDIIKADIIGEAPVERRDELTEKWEELEVQTGRDGFNDLFSYIRMIYAREKARRSLLEEFREHVLSEVKTPDRLIEEILEPLAEAYLVVKNCRYVATKNSEEVNALLGWLNRIDNSDWIPPAILFLSKHKDDPEYVLTFFRDLERLAAYLHVCAKNVNFRIDRYSQLLDELHLDHSLGDPIYDLGLTSEECEEMREALDGNIYWLTPRRRNYVILRLDSFLSDAAAIYDPSRLTIEHVLPQTVEEGSEWADIWPDEELREKWTHRIANLVPLNRRRNSAASNYPFTKKKNAYFSGRKDVSSYVLTTQVLSAPEWTLGYIEQRQIELVDVMREGWNV